MVQSTPTKAHRPLRFVFSSDDLPSHLDDCARQRLWRETLERVYGSFEHAYAGDQPFSMRLELMRVGMVALAECDGSLVQAGRSRSNVAANGCEDFMVGINAGRSPALQRHHRREVALAPFSPTLVSLAEEGEVLTEPNTPLRWIGVPRQRLVEQVANVDDHLARPVDPRLPAARHLQRYLNFLLEPEGVEDDPMVADQVATTLFDLICLCLGAERDAAEIARMRGLRAARLQEVLAEIRAGFAEPAFAVDRVACKLGVSPRSVQDLLHETGRTFGERVLELRLQRAKAMLRDPGCDHLKISDIAYACGFSAVSYFNRCFRRRFGATPTQFR